MYKNRKFKPMQTCQIFICNAFICPCPYIISYKDILSSFCRSFFFTLLPLRHFLNTELFTNDTFFRRSNIFQHSSQRHQHSNNIFCIFFAYLSQGKRVLKLYSFYMYVLSYSIFLGWAQGKHWVQGRFGDGKGVENEGIGVRINLLES